MMHITMKYTFPLLPPISNPLCTSFMPGAEGTFGFVIKGLPDPVSEHGIFSLFQLNALSGNVSQHSTALAPGHINHLHLCYDSSNGIWVLGVEGYQESLVFYEIQPGINQPWRQLSSIERADMGLGDKFIVILWQYDQHYPLVFAMRDIVEVSDSPLYWTSWRPLQQGEGSRYRMLGYCDSVLPYISHGKCLLFLCLRAFDREPKDVDFRQGSGHWQIAIAAYSAAGILIRQTSLPNIGFSIRNIHLPEKDLFQWLRVHFYASSGPQFMGNDNPTCLAALSLEDTSLTVEEQATKGGLFCIDMNGHILYQEASPLGKQVSLCVCNQTIIGTDVFGGTRRLWHWLPQNETEKHIEQILSPQVLRATVLTVEGDNKQFWCVEEYHAGIHVSRRDSDNRLIQDEIWVENMTLLDEMVVPYSRERKPKGVVAWKDALFLLGINTEQRLQLLQLR
jgi:hypothetical protein